MIVNGEQLAAAMSGFQDQGELGQKFLQFLLTTNSNSTAGASTTIGTNNSNATSEEGRTPSEDEAAASTLIQVSGTASSSTTSRGDNNSTTTSTTAEVPPVPASNVIQASSPKLVVSSGMPSNGTVAAVVSEQQIQVVTTDTGTSATNPVRLDEVQATSEGATQVVTSIPRIIPLDPVNTGAAAEAPESINESNNAGNKRKRKRIITSRFKGVSSEGDYWKVQISVDKKTKSYRGFTSEIEAAMDYDKRIYENRGPAAKKNFKFVPQSVKPILTSIKTNSVKCEFGPVDTQQLLFSYINWDTFNHRNITKLQDASTGNITVLAATNLKDLGLNMDPPKPVAKKRKNHQSQNVETAPPATRHPSLEQMQKNYEHLLSILTPEQLASISASSTATTTTTTTTTTAAAPRAVPVTASTAPNAIVAATPDVASRNIDSDSEWSRED